MDSSDFCGSSVAGASDAYHVLGGALSAIDGIDPSDLKIDELVSRVPAGGRRRS